MKTMVDKPNIENEIKESGDVATLKSNGLKKDLIEKTSSYTNYAFYNSKDLYNKEDYVKMDDTIDSIIDDAIETFGKKTEKVKSNYSSLIPIFLDPSKNPKKEFLKYVEIYKTNKPLKEWFIVRNFNDFKEVIKEVFGTFSKPTEIPLALSTCFYLEEGPKKIIKPASSFEIEDEENVEFLGTQQYEKKQRRVAAYSYTIPSFNTTDSFYGTIAGQQKKIEKPRINQKFKSETGLDCCKWLLENNYVPAFVNVHDSEYTSKYENEIRNLFVEYSQKTMIPVETHVFYIS